MNALEAAKLSPAEFVTAINREVSKPVDSEEIAKAASKVFEEAASSTASQARANLEKHIVTQQHYNDIKNVLQEKICLASQGAKSERKWVIGLRVLLVACAVFAAASAVAIAAMVLAPSLWALIVGSAIASSAVAAYVLPVAAAALACLAVLVSRPLSRHQDKLNNYNEEFNNTTESLELLNNPEFQQWVSDSFYLDALISYDVNGSIDRVDGRIFSLWKEDKELRRLRDDLEARKLEQNTLKDQAQIVKDTIEVSKADLKKDDMKSHIKQLKKSIQDYKKELKKEEAKIKSIEAENESAQQLIATLERNRADLLKCFRSSNALRAEIL